MLRYQRRPLPELLFHDESGAVIPYGRRWADQNWDGPDETYSVTAHPERFAPFVDVARAIVEHLDATYEARREETDEVASITRVRLVPSDPTAAPLEFTFGPRHMVHVTAGIATGVAWFCHCDHCDEDVQVAIENLEQEVSAVVDGGLREWLNDPAQGYDGDDLFLAHEIRSSDGAVNIGGSSIVTDEEARDELRARFADVPLRWAPWPLRSR